MFEMLKGVERIMGEDEWKEVICPGCGNTNIVRYFPDICDNSYCQFPLYEQSRGAKTSDGITISDSPLVKHPPASPSLQDVWDGMHTEPTMTLPTTATCRYCNRSIIFREVSLGTWRWVHKISDEEHCVEYVAEPLTKQEVIIR